MKDPKNKIIGLVLAFKTTNYGAQLQAYATQQVINSFGLKSIIIDYRKPFGSFRHISWGKGVLRFYLESRQQARLKKRYRADVTNDAFVQNNKQRKKQSQAFIEKRLEGVQMFHSFGQLSATVRHMSALLIGSDQKWGPGACYSKISSLEVAPDDVRKISYATSLGVSSYPKYCYQHSKKMWSRIDYLSVREKQGAEIIKDVCGEGIKVEVVVDPTYLLTKEKWEELIPTQSFEKQKYVLCYFLGNDDGSKKCAKNFASAHGLTLVSIMSNESYSPYDNEFADILVKGASPEDFVNWIRGAEYIFTDSFHGMAFSVINEKQFYIFYRRRLDAKQSRNSRIDNLLSMFNITDRLIESNDINWTESKGSDINYTEVNHRLSEERERSMRFLKEALTF